MSGFAPLNDGWRNDASWQPPVNPDAFLPLENTPLDDGSDSWWAGVQHSFVSVPRAASLATLGLSAALCAGLQQQTDEVPSWLPAEVSAHASVPQRLRYTTTFKRWEVVDELPGTTPVALEESTWVPGVALADVRPAPLSQLEDELPPLVVALEDGAWAAPLPPLLDVRTLLWPQADELPSLTPVALDEGEWVQTPPAVVRSAAQPLSDTDELAWLPDDSYWWRGEWLPAKLAGLAPSDVDELPVVAQPALDEGYWRADAAVWGAMWVAPTPAVPDEVPTAPTALLVDDTLWLTDAPVLAVPGRWTAHATDEVVPQPAPTLENDAWAVTVPVTAALWLRVPGDVDELPAPPPALEDSYWTTSPPTVTVPLRLALADVNELPLTLPLALEDERWVPGFALAVPPSRLAIVDTDVAVTQPAPQVEETYWFTQPSLPSRFYCYDFLAQEDLVPSASLLESLARTYAVNAEHRGYAVNAEQRQAVQRAEQRTLIVDPQRRNLT